MLAGLIKTHAANELASADWQGVATAIRGLNRRQTPRKCFSVETGAALLGAGVNWQQVMALIDGDVTGRFLLSKLAADGVEWAHAMTVPYLRSKQGNVLTAAGVDALVDLSAPLLYATLTGEECRSEMQAEAARTAYEVVRGRRQAWDRISADIRSRIESGSLTDNASVVAAVQGGL